MTVLTPYIPVNVILQTGNGKNFLLWDQVAGATSYAIERSTDGISFSSIGTSGTSNFLDSTVSTGISYYYQVASVNASGTSAYAPSYPTSIVPCLPGQINLGYLRYMSQLRADKLNSQYLTTDEWNFNIEQSKCELYDILVTKFGDDYFLAPPLIIPLTGLQYYPLPDGSNYPINGVNSPACYKLLSVAGNISGAAPGPNAGWVPLARFNVSDLYKYTTFPNQAGSLNNIYQAAYREIGSNLWIIPTNQGQLIQILYVPIATQLLQDTDMLPFSFSAWSEYIINDVARKAMVKEESLEKWTALGQANDLIRERIETTAANRDVGSPNSVSNVRATQGDPSFSGWGGSGGFGSGWGSY